MFGVSKFRCCFSVSFNGQIELGNCTFDQKTNILVLTKESNNIAVKIELKAKIVKFTVTSNI